MSVLLMLNWEATEHGLAQGVTMEWMGFIPTFINAADPRPAAEQIDEQYQHGGGWRPLKGWEMNTANGVITYPGGDPPLTPLFKAEHVLENDKKETLYFYDSAWTGIVQEDGSFEVSRLD